MAKGDISINFISDTKPLVRDVNAMTDALEDGADELVKFGKAGEKAGDKAGDGLKDGIKDGTRSAERDLQDMEDALRQVAQESKKTGTATGNNLKQGSAVAKESMAEVKNEALQNASETFSSFDGSASSFVDGVQGTFGGLVASLGAISPALIPIGIAGAAAVGLISAAVQNGEQDTEEFKQKVSELATQLIDSGVVGERSFDDMVDSVKDLATETDDSKVSLKKLEDIAKTLNVPFEDVVRAYEAGGQPLQDLIDKTNELDKANEGLGATPIFGQVRDGALEYEEKLNDITGKLTDQQKAITKATELQALYFDSGVSEMEVKAGLINQVNDAYDDSASSVEDYLNKETGLFDVSKYITAMTERSKALAEYQDNLAKSGLSAEAKKFLEDQGAESASLMLQGYKNASPAQQAELSRIWSEAGKSNSGTYADNFQTGL